MSRAIKEVRRDAMYTGPAEGRVCRGISRANKEVRRYGMGAELTCEEEGADVSGRVS
jgi:hypothetical protein